MRRIALLSLLPAAIPFLATPPAAAQAIIENPGDHPEYAVELDPHLVLQHGYTPVWLDTGVGLGLRATIPFLDGPIQTINNSMGISFGLDWAHFGNRDCYDYYWRYHPDSRPPATWRYNCGGDAFVFPVALQWNFWLTDIISVFGEPGIAVSYTRWEAWCGDYDGVCHEDRLRVDPFVMWVGGRFLFGERAGMTVRLGYPSVTVGGSFLF